MDRNAPWLPLFEDQDHQILLLSRLTGAVREAPWISLRTANGAVYFGNVITRETRWFPPHRWIEGWITRPSPHMQTNKYGENGYYGHPLFPPRSVYLRDMLPPEIGRLRVDGGAPYMHSGGLPQYAPDAYDTPRTHPAATATADAHHWATGFIAGRGTMTPLMLDDRSGRRWTIRTVPINIGHSSASE